MRPVLIAAAGALLGYVAESVHRSAGVWSLPAGAPLPWWIALVYFAALYGAGRAFAALDRRCPLPPGTRVFDVAWVLALFLAPPLLHHHELLLTAIAGALLVGRLGVRRAPGDLLVAIALPILDLAVEGGLVAAGLFRYAHASLGPFPLWLAPLWAGLGLGLRRVFAAAR